MPQSRIVNRRIVLNSRPVGAPIDESFHLEELAIPVPPAGQVFLRTLFLSLDPYRRGRMSVAPSYAAPVITTVGCTCTVSSSISSSTTSRVLKKTISAREPSTFSRATIVFPQLA
jgi:NADPH-dependent curcumin reductase CurA